MSLPLQKNRTLRDDEVSTWPPGEGEVETSLLLDELRERFRREGRHVEVDFRQLIGWIRIGDQLTHQIHPYPAKLLPNIAHMFARATSLHQKRSCILDPFCGSGTVALEASLAGHTPYIADANPFALLLAKVKTTPYQPDELREKTAEIIAQAKRLRTAPVVPIVNEHLWYAADKKKSLEILLRSILETSDGDQRDFFLVSFSVTARRLSFADPAISVPVRLRTKETFGETHNRKILTRLQWIKQTNVLAEFAKVCEANIERVKESNLVQKGRIAAVQVGADARNLKSPKSNTGLSLEARSIPLIVTSPPYGSAQKYIRASSLSLNWLGLAGPTELSALEGKSIGREHLPFFRQEEIPEKLPKIYEQMLSRVKRTNETRARIARQYLHDMKRALYEMARVTANGGHIVLVVGNNMVCGEPLRNDAYMTDVLQNLGLKLEIGLIDHIKSRGLMTKRNKTASLISRESVLVFSK